MIYDRHHLANKYNDVRHITWIQLSKMQLTSIEANTFANLTKISHIDLNHNLLSHIEKNLFHGLVELTHINLNYNKIDNIDILTFSGLNKLTELILADNLISSIDLNLFNGLIKLKILRLDYNHLSSIHPNLFNGLINLEVIGLSNNKLESIDPNQFNNLTKLRHIYLSHNHLHSIDSNQFNGLNELTYIDLSCNQLKSLDCSTFNELNKLTHIFLHKNSFKSDKIELILEKSVKFVSFKHGHFENDIDHIITIKRKDSHFHSNNNNNNNIIALINNEPQQPQQEQQHHPHNHEQYSKDYSSEDIVFKNKYKCLELLGNGSFGRVFKVENLKDHKYYALKIVADSFVDENFFHESNEAKLLKELSSPYIVEYEDCFFQADRFFIVTEYCKDGDLSVRLKERRHTNHPFDRDTIFLWSKEMLLGLNFLHEHLIIHRDIKPANLFLQNGHIKLGDLGCAKNISDTVAKTIKGTVKYMSPEMILCVNGYSFKSDIWSTGIIIYELITLKYPFKCASNDCFFKLAESILYDEIPPLKQSTPEQLKNLIKMTLQKNPEQRADSKQLKLYFI